MPIADKCYTMAVPSPRSMAPEELAQLIRNRGVEAEVLAEDTNLLELSKSTNVLCIAGSLYLIQSLNI